MDNYELSALLNNAAGVTPEETGCFMPPNGVITKCAMFPCDKCEYYYGELNECMRIEVEESFK